MMITNQLRNIIGLKPFDSEWIEFEQNFLDAKVYVSKENIIEKVIFSKSQNIYYKEEDYCIALDSKEHMIPKKGKPRALNLSNFMKIKPKDISLTIEKNSVRIANHKNYLLLIDEYGLKNATIQEGVQIIEEYISNTSDYWKKQLERFKNASKTSRVKIKSGDIFRIPLKNKQFAFGRIISPLRNTIKEKLPVVGGFDLSDWPVNIFDPQPNFFPLWVEFFLFKTSDPMLDIGSILMKDTSSSTIIGDYSIRHSNFEIIGNAKIDLKKVDVPMLVDIRYQFKPNFHFLNWGAGIITFKTSKDLVKLIESNNMRYKQYFSLSRGAPGIDLFISSNIKDKVDHGFMYNPNDLRCHDLKETKTKTFKLLGLKEDMDYDDFAIKYGFKTKQEIIDNNK